MHSLLKCFVVLVLLAGIVLLPACDEDDIEIGTLLPLTGDLSQFGGPMQEGARLAIEQVNQNGGVLGKNIRLVNEDSETSPTTAASAMIKLVNVDKVPVVIGAAGSSVSMAIISIAVDNKVVQISPSNTATGFTTFPDDGFYFRTCPSDALQGKAMAKLASEKGYMTANTLAINNDYGVGFEGVFVREFEAMGGEVNRKVRYSPEATTFDSEVNKVAEGDPDVIILIGYPETGSIILKSAYQNGLMDDIEWLFSEGLRSPGLADLIGKNDDNAYVIAGFEGTTPDPRMAGPAHGEFENAYKDKYDKDSTTFVPNTYDAAAIVALAIEKAGRDEDGEVKADWKLTGEAIRDAIPDVTNPNGEPVADIGEALELIRAGKDINYQGASGELTFDDDGDVTGSYCIWQVGSDGSIELGDSIEIE